MFISFLFILIMLNSAMTFGQTPLACSATNEKTNVIYFGGHRGSQNDLDLWAASANANPRYNHQFRFQAHSLNEPNSRKEDVLRRNADNIRNCIRKINSPGFAGPIVLVGHSDGAWVVNEIVKRVELGNRAKIRLVNLDGYSSNGSDVEGAQIHCWTSVSIPSRPAGQSLACSEIPAGATVSLYTSEMRNCKNGCRALNANTTCQSSWCLHFSLANRNASQNITRQNYGTEGYRDVQPELQFLDGFMSATTRDANPPSLLPGRR